MCQYCLRNPCPPGCPNYIAPKPRHYCSICGDGIYPGDRYVENINGEYIHFECIQSIRQLLEWLGYEIKECDEFEIGLSQSHWL